MKASLDIPIHSSALSGSWWSQWDS
jgi:hypothetical protein